MPDTTPDLAARIARLEAVAAVTALKHRYFRACDAKDPDGFLGCFVPGAELDYGSLGKHDAEGMAALFASIALRQVDGGPAVLDMHHGVHPDITVHDDTTAEGRWTLKFRQVNLLTGTESVATGEYADEYRLVEGHWKIARSTFTQLWSITRPLGPDVRVKNG